MLLAIGIIVLGAVGHQAGQLDPDKLGFSYHIPVCPMKCPS